MISPWIIRRFGRGVAHEATFFPDRYGDAWITNCGLVLRGDLITFNPIKHIADRRCKRCEKKAGKTFADVIELAPRLLEST